MPPERHPRSSFVVLIGLALLACVTPVVTSLEDSRALVWVLGCATLAGLGRWLEPARWRVLGLEGILVLTALLGVWGELADWSGYWAAERRRCLGLLGLVFAGMLLVPLRGWVVRGWGYHGLLHYAFLLRVPLLAGLLLVAGPFAMQGSSLAANLLLVPAWPELIVVGITVGIAAMIVTTCFELVVRYAPARYAVPCLQQRIFHLRPGPALSWTQVGIALALCLPLLASISIDAFPFELRDALQSTLASLGAVVGIAAVVAVRFVNDRYRPKTRDNTYIAKTGITPWFLGYRALRGGILPGHLGVATSWLFLFLIFAVMGAQEETAWLVRVTPPLASLMLLVALLAMTLSGLSFFFDALRVPLVLIVVLWTVAAGALTGSTHRFSTFERAVQDADFALAFPADDGAQAPALSAARRRIHLAEEQGLVHPQRVLVVCAAGGGIQAAAWTTKVLQKLGTHPTLQARILLLSGVSGGSVGLAFYAAVLDRKLAQDPHSDGSLSPRELQSIADAARSDSLNALAWGLVFKDLRRPFGLFIDEELDRGVALQNQWTRHLPHTDHQTTLAGLAAHAASGRAPVIALNSTIAGSGLLTNDKGRRMVFSSMHLGSPTWDGPTDFFGTYGRDRDIPILHAARLSAAFPYVSPMARQDGNAGPPHFLADGGYFDNLGFSTALDWWLQVRELELEVAFVSVLPFPQRAQGRPLPSHWLTAVTGPIDLLMATWRTTQVDRGALEQRLLTLASNAHAEVFRFQPENLQREPPLSWRLSEREMDDLDRGWAEANDKELVRLTDWILQR